MGILFERTAISLSIKERLDFSCSIHNGEDGGLVVNAPHIPIHVGVRVPYLKLDLADGAMIVARVHGRRRAVSTQRVAREAEIWRCPAYESSRHVSGIRRHAVVSRLILKNILQRRNPSSGSHCYHPYFRPEGPFEDPFLCSISRSPRQ